MKVINSCLREYYYTYYGSHNGWTFEASEEQRVAWRLKKLSNIWLALGDKIHEAIKLMITNNTQEEKKQIVKDYIKKELNKIVRCSIENYKTGAWDEYPRGDMLQDYYYGGKLDEKSINEIKDRIDLCVNSYFYSRSYIEINNENTKVLEIDEGKFDYITIEGLKVYALIDALYINSNYEYVIVDWKTGGSSDEDREQLLVYALYVMEKYNVPISKIVGRVEYLLTEENIEYRFSKEDIKSIEDRIKLDINVIDALLEDKDLNKPRYKEDFLKCENLKKCSKCKFRKLCLREEL